MSKSSKTTARRSARTGSLELFVHPHRSVPARLFGLLWRWRIEVITVVVLVTVLVALSDHLPTWAVWVIEGAAVAVVLVIPVVRRFVLRRVWCVITRHRLRKCFVQSRVMTHEGLLPLFIWTRPTPVGERVRLWLRPGLSAKDVESAADRIAAACWAREARVVVNPDRVSTVWVHVIRRDPLAAAGQIRSPLLDGVQVEPTELDTESVPLPDRATVLAALPEQGTAVGDTSPVTSSATATRAAATMRTPTRSTPTGQESWAVVSWSGEDVSDYV